MKLTRKQIMTNLGEIQSLVGLALSDYWNDRAPDRADRVEKSLKAAHDLCVKTRD